MKRENKHKASEKVIAVLLVFILITGIMPFGMSQPAYAAGLAGGGTVRRNWFNELLDREKETLEKEEEEGVEEEEGEEGDGTLTLNEEQAAPVEALGFSTDQPERYTPGGQLVDRTKSPFGVNKVTKYGVNQLMVNLNLQNSLYEASFPLGSTFRDAKQSLIQDIQDNGTPVLDLNNIGERVSVAADTDGDGKDEVVNVFLASGKVGLSITQYVDNTAPGYTKKAVTKTYPNVRWDTGIFSNTMPSLNDKYRFMYAVSGDFDHDGKDEVAIGYRDSIVLCRITTTELTILSSLQLNNNSANYRAMAENGNFSGRFKNRTVNGMLAADLDDDGFKELFVTAGSSYVSKATEDTDEDINDYEKGDRSYLMIFRYTTDVSTLSEPTVELTASAGENAVYIDNPGMDIGDIFGDGEKELVIGGRLFGRKDNNNVGLIALHYDPESDSYQTGLKDNRLYTFVSDEFKAVQNKLGVKCVNFDPAAFMSFVVFGGFIYKYNPETDAFDKQIINSTNSSGLKVNSEAKSKNNLTNTNVSKDKTYILDMVAGNFNELTLENIGKDTSEQLVVLHHNEWYDSRRIYVTTVSMTDGVLYADMRQVANNKNNGYYFSICAPDIYDRGLQMEFLPGESEFIFSDPVVVSVLAATPYYEELMDEYEAIGNAKTLFGTEKSKSSSQSHGLSVSASFICGYEFSLNLFYGNISQAAWELEVSNEFTATFENYSSVTKSILYENYYNQNAVIVSAIPYDCYYFQVTNTETGASEKTMIMVPFSPVTRIMSFSAYKKVADTISVIPKVDDVFSHRVGDPRTYPSVAAGLSNVEDAEIQLGISGDDYGNFVGVGVGNNVTEQGISITQGKSRTLENKLEVKFTMTAGAGGVYVGGSAALGYTYSSTKSNEETTMYSGSVSGLPEDRESYSYKWSLAAYPYDLTVGDSTQRCMVIGYLCRPVGANYPPAPVQNFRVDKRSATEVTLKWDAPETAGVQAKGLPSGYILYRDDSGEGDYTQIATISGRNNVTYTDYEATGDACSYMIIAMNTRYSTPVTLEVPRIRVAEIAVKTAPRLSYADGEELDLSDLAVTLTYEDESSQDLAFADFGENFIVSVADGSALNTAQQGTQLTVTYVPDGITLNAGTLEVSAEAAYDISLTASFTVGNTNNATALEAGKSVSASASLSNNTGTAQQVLVILALYSDKGTMVASSVKAVNVAAGGTASAAFTSVFTVPAAVTGYTVKLFAWDGTSISDTRQIPKSNVMTLR